MAAWPEWIKNARPKKKKSWNCERFPPEPSGKAPLAGGGMELLGEGWSALLYLLDMALHIDVHLRGLAGDYGAMIYLFLFLVVFCETGLVVTPFLPGDSLLFAGGALVGAGMLDYAPLAAVLLSAAIAGDALNFRIGRFLGPPVFQRNYRLLKREYLDRAHAFYELHGGKAIVLARFIPIIRTFAPFVAGAAGMRQDRFLFFNITGAAGWVFSLVSAGALLGSLPFVRNNFSLIVYGIIAVSLLPLALEVLKKSRIGGALGRSSKQRPLRPADLKAPAGQEDSGQGQSPGKDAPAA
jgi:membrane-associated protein